MKVEVGHYYNEKRVLISTEKILTLFFLLVTFLFISLSLSLSYFMSDIHQKIVQESGKTLCSFDFLIAVGICAVLL